MPVTYTDNDQVRTRLVAQGKQWRAALAKVRTSKHEGVKDLANTVEEVVDELTAGIIHCASECEKQSSRGENLEELLSRQKLSLLLRMRSRGSSMPSNSD